MKLWSTLLLASLAGPLAGCRTQSVFEGGPKKDNPADLPADTVAEDDPSLQGTGPDQEYDAVMPDGKDDHGYSGNAYNTLTRPFNSKTAAGSEAAGLVTQRQSLPGPIVPYNFSSQNANLLGANDINALADLGFRYIRISIDVNAPNYARLDPLVNTMWVRGVMPFMILFGDIKNPPSNTAAYDDFSIKAAAVAAHYAGGGMLFEIWNEPDNPIFWRDPNPAAYAEMAIRTAIRIRDVSGHLIVGPGVTTMEAKPGKGATYVAAMLAQRPELVNYFDAISVHGYGPTGKETPESRLPQYNTISKLTAARGHQLPIVLSEWGWSVVEAARCLRAHKRLTRRAFS